MLRQLAMEETDRAAAVLRASFDQALPTLAGLHQSIALALPGRNVESLTNAAGILMSAACTRVGGNQPSRVDPRAGRQTRAMQSVTSSARGGPYVGIEHIQRPRWPSPCGLQRT
jgi:hypothetical protein